MIGSSSSSSVLFPGTTTSPTDGDSWSLSWLLEFWVLPRMDALWALKESSPHAYRSKPSSLIIDSLLNPSTSCSWLLGVLHCWRNPAGVSSGCDSGLSGGTSILEGFALPPHFFLLLLSRRLDSTPLSEYWLAYERKLPARSSSR